MSKVNWINFDFGKNWKSMVVQHLNTKECRNILRECYEQFKRYDYDEVAPYTLSSNDGTDSILFDICQEVINNKDSRYLTKREISILNKLDDDRDDSKIWDNIYKRLGYDWKTSKDKLIYYVPFGTCHIWNRVFCLWLAKKVFPQNKWVFRMSEKHTTVVCYETHQVFDLIYWALDNRLQNYVKSETKINSYVVPTTKYTNDPSLGANLAIHNSS